MGDGAEVLNGLLLGHSNTRVMNAKGLGSIITAKPDLKRERLVHQGRGVIALGVAELLQGVRGVGHQLADEDLLLRIEGACHDIKKLLGLRLELVNCSKRGNTIRISIVFKRETKSPNLRALIQRMHQLKKLKLRTSW